MTLLLWKNSSNQEPLINDPVLLILLTYTLLTAGIAYLTPKKILAVRTYTYITIVTDTCGISLLLTFGGEFTSPMCIAYYLLILHHGSTAQNRELLLTTSFSIIGFATTLYRSDYWNSQIILGTGILIGLTLTTLILYRNKTIQRALALTHAEKSAGTQHGIKLLLITNDYKDRHMLLSYIDSWGINVAICNSTIRAFAELVNSAEDGNGYTTVIVDSLNLDMDPMLLGKSIQSDNELFKTHLIYISPEHEVWQREQLIEAGYTTILTTPIDKTLLFNALHISDSKTADDDNISRLIHHYSSKTNNKPSLDILLAVCDKPEQELFRTALEHNGHRIYTVSDGFQTLNALQTHQFDIVVLDFHMPDMDGSEVIRLYYYTYLSEDWIPFIALVDRATPETLSQCRAAEVSAILARPVKKEELLITISDIASSRTKQTETIDRHWHQSHLHKTLIKDDYKHIINTQTLIQLEKLSSSKDFLTKLTTTFNDDMDCIMEGLARSIDNNSFTDFKDLAYALKDSSCNMGAVLLHKLSLLALQINQREFNEQARTLLKEIHEALAETKRTLQDYAQVQGNSASNNE